MMTRKQWLWPVAAIALVLTGCNVGHADEGEPKKLRLGHIQSESNAWHKGSLKLPNWCMKKQAVLSR